MIRVIPVYFFIQIVFQCVYQLSQLDSSVVRKKNTASLDHASRKRRRSALKRPLHEGEASGLGLKLVDFSVKPGRPDAKLPKDYFL